MVEFYDISAYPTASLPENKNDVKAILEILVKA